MNAGKFARVWGTTRIYVLEATPQHGTHPGNGVRCTNWNLQAWYQGAEVHTEVPEHQLNLIRQSSAWSWMTKASGSICTEPSQISFYYLLNIRNTIGSIEFQKKIVLKCCISVVGCFLPLSCLCYPNRNINQRQCGSAQLLSPITEFHFPVDCRWGTAPVSPLMLSAGIFLHISYTHKVQGSVFPGHGSSQFVWGGPCGGTCEMQKNVAPRKMKNPCSIRYSGKVKMFKCGCFSKSFIVTGVI